MADERYPAEVDEDDLHDSMSEGVSDLQRLIVGRKIVTANTEGDTTILTLDDGRRVKLANSYDCCAYTEVDEFFLDPSMVDHMILGVGTTDKFTQWHIYADFGDIMKMKVGWSASNGYYGYGFTITVQEVNG